MKKKTIEALAQEKKLPADFLHQLNLRDLGGGAIGIPYFGESGEELFERRRNPPGANPRFVQPKGTKLLPYGLNRLDAARKHGHLYLCEGESDTWTLWHLGLPALGIPGAGAAKALTADHVEGIDSILLLPDSDNAGEQFVEGIRLRLGELSYNGRLKRVRLPAPHKDFSEWFIVDGSGRPKTFLKHLTAAVENAEPLAVQACRQLRNGIATNQRPEATPCLRVLRVRTAAEIQATPTKWLWYGRIPLGAITILDGDPGLGKSTISVDIAAHVSRGRGMPLDGRSDLDGPADVLILSAEDSPEQTVRPRLDAAGADPQRVHVVEATRVGEEDERPPILPADLDLLAEMVKDRGVRLIIVDPFMAYLDGQLDAHRDQDVRRCLHRLKMLAEATGAAVLLIRHLNKLTGGAAIYRGGGSIGISGAARSVLMAGKDPADARRFVLAAIKCNLCAMPPALTYSIATADNGVSVIGWGQETTVSADDLLGYKRPGASTAEQCAELLRELLADGEKPATDVEEELKANGFTANAIREARKLVKVRAVKGGFAEGWIWKLPDGNEENGPDNDVKIPPGW